MKKALFPGTFDPPTNGHLWVVIQGLELFDNINIGIGVNPGKQPLFTVLERVALWNKILDDEIKTARSRVAVNHYTDEFTVNYAKLTQCQFILRGLRTVQDYHDECSLQQINQDIAPAIDSVYLMSPHEMVEIASSKVKGMMGYHGWENVVSKYVPGVVLQSLIQKKKNPRT